MKTIKPNLNLLRDHGTHGGFQRWKKGNGINPGDAFCLKFKQSNKTLYYIGAIHTIDVNSKTYKYIKKVIVNNKPNLVVIEGYPFSKGISPHLKPFQGEAGYAIAIAQKHLIQYCGIETNETEILQKLAKEYDIDDIYGYMFLRMHRFSFKTLHILQKQFINEFIEKEKQYLDKIFDNTNWEPLHWFKNKFGRKFVYGDNLDYSSPTEGTDIITQQIAFSYSKIRNMKNIKNLYDLINKFDTIVYIMGQNHVYSDLNVLLDTFGKYSILEL